MPSDIKTCSNAPPEPSETGASSPSGVLGCIGRCCLVTRHSREIMLWEWTSRRSASSLVVFLLLDLFSWQLEAVYLYNSLRFIYHHFSNKRDLEEKETDMASLYICRIIFPCTKTEGYFCSLLHLSWVRIIFPYKTKYRKKLNNWHIIKENNKYINIKFGKSCHWFQP